MCNVNDLFHMNQVKVIKKIVPIIIVVYLKQPPFIISFALYRHCSDNQLSNIFRAPSLRYKLIIFSFTLCVAYCFLSINCLILYFSKKYLEPYGIHSFETSIFVPISTIEYIIYVFLKIILLTFLSFILILLILIHS